MLTRALRGTVAVCVAALALTPVVLAIYPAISPAATGGPDGFGYTYIDSAEGLFTPVFAPDISPAGSGAGTVVTSGDDATATVALASPFTFYGVSHFDLVASTNGWLDFDLTSLGAPDFSNDCPDPGTLGERVIPLHDDLVAGAVYSAFAVAQAHPLGSVEPATVIMWDEATQFGGVATFDFWAILYHTSGDVYFEYSTGNPDLGSGSTTGIHSASAGAGLTYACNTDDSLSADRFGILFQPGQPNESDISITKSDDIDPVMPGQTLTYTVSVDNAGPDDAENVVVTDTLPAGVTLIATGGCAEDPGGAPTCSLGTIVAGGSATYTIEVTVHAGAGGTLTNTASVTSDSVDPDTSNNSTSEETAVDEPEADLSITKTAEPDPVAPGEMLTYTVAVSNAGPDDAENVVVTDTLPPGFTVVSTTGCFEDPAGVPTCSLGTIAAGATAGFTIVVTVDPTFVNEASVGSSTSDPDPGDNVATVEVTISTGHEKPDRPSPRPRTPRPRRGR